LVLYPHDRRDNELPFRIELWDDKNRRVEELIALTSDYATACGAYDEAVGEDPASSSLCARKLG
jgi:hypothetical protein